ncbi:M16 family metallopeptidase [Sphingobium yanoikuyae]|uniref:M16 family metallopeptidase n=1 Tax=Sphingobium yanoikuyae TaxID=13690 RepID=UPI0007C80099|nr:pitrilysin family protein [Sphingobium yanoikuyae]
MSLLAVLALTTSSTALASAGSSKAVPDPLAGLALDIPATRFVLPNGLTVIVHEDHSAPLVAVSVWYHVGSKNEPKGKTGFAHLFEHLMFNGSENFNDDFFKATQKIGATEQNGTTNADRTNYFETVPKSGLDTILWLESDRMGHLLGAIDQGKLNEQRAVVENEKRQGQNRPYAKAEDLIVRATQPVGHPYDHTTIGSMVDLEAASLDDVKGWFRAYYGPSNAILVLSGDITPAEARAKVEKYFGDIAPGEPVTHPKAWVAKLSSDIDETTYDRVAQPRLILTWNVPGFGSRDGRLLDILGDVLAGDRSSRLYKRLVVDQPLATSVSAGTDGQEIEGQFQIDVMLKPGGDVGRVRQIVNEEVRRLIDGGATAGEMQRMRVRYEGALARSFESISEKAALLAQSQTYLGSPDAWKGELDLRRTATSADVQRAGGEWLKAGSYALSILPFGDLKAASTGADRKTLPLPDSIDLAHFPTVERATLTNGLKLVVAHRGGNPLVNMTLLVDTGIPQDYDRIAPDTASLAMNLLDEGTLARTGTQLNEALGALGAALSTSGDGESGQVGISLLKPTLKQALPIFADVILNPAFRPADVDRVKAQTVAGIRSGRKNPSRVASRLLPRLVLGSDGPYGRFATEQSVDSIGIDDLKAFHDRWFHPNNATLVVTGDTSLAEIRPMIEAAFASWRPAAVPQTITPPPAVQSKSVVYLVDAPDTPQSVIQVAVAAPPRREGDEVSRRLFNMAFGGSFTARVNMKLREEKGWSYGAHSRISGGRGPRMFVAYSSVQSDKTAESLHELDLLLQAVTAGQPIDAKELATAKGNLTLGLASDWSTVSEV